jgi:glycosyltransferase involved in cell wall biosynthesis
MSSAETTETPSERAKNANIVVVMPAYNAAKTIAETQALIPPGIVDKVIVVDDASRDDTVSEAEKLDVEVISHPHNVGYGGNQKTCYMAALRDGADVVVMLHPDNQYDPEILPAMVEPILAGEAEMTLGSRFLQPGGPARGGMPKYKIVANRTLTTIENYVLGTHFSELHTGYRAYSRHFLETVPFLRNSNDFVFDSQIIAQSVAFKMPVKEVPVQTKYFPEASSTTLRQSVVYGSKTLAVMLRYRLHTSARLKAAVFLP